MSGSYELPLLYLPVSRATVETFIARTSPPAELLERLSGPERCALFVVQQLAELKVDVCSAAVAESLLSDLIRTTNEADPQAFASELLSHLDPGKLSTGHDLCWELGISLLTDEDIRRRGFLTVTREWDGGYTARRGRELQDYEEHFKIPGVPRSRSLSHEQYRVPQTVLGTLDDHLHIQGYSGTGKSHLIRVAIDTLLAQGVPAERILVLTYTWGQLNAIRGILPTGVACKTVNAIIEDILPPTLIDPTVKHLRKRSAPTATIGGARIAQHYGLSGVGKLTAIDLANLAKRTVSKFCTSPAPVIGEQHLPAGFGPSPWRENDPVYTQQAKVVLKVADDLWKDTLLPRSPDFKPPVHGLHQVKYCVLQGLGLPNCYSHVVADEAHDLSAAVLQLLDNSSLPGTSFSDDYQNLAAQPGSRSAGIRVRHLVRSWRAGSSLEQVVNPLLQAHPIQPRELYKGSPDIPTEIKFYEKVFIPEKGAAIVAADNWGLWAWAQRLVGGNKQAYLLGAENDLNVFVLDAIELFHRDIPARHRDLHNFLSWSLLDSKLQNRWSYKQLLEALERGYESKHWERTYQLLQEGGERSVSLGTVHAIKNMDFDVVLLSPDLVELLWYSKPRELAAVESAIYTAATRVKRRLFVPSALRDWFEERGLR